jgi:precorrin-2 dehydrogenase
MNTHVDFPVCLRLSGWLRKSLPRGAERMELPRQLVEGEAGDLMVRGQRRAAWARVRTALEDFGETRQ